MSTYNYSVQAVYTSDNGGAIRILTTYNGITWDYYVGTAGTLLSYTLGAGQAMNVVQTGNQFYGPGQDIWLTYDPNGGTKFKYLPDSMGDTIGPNFTISETIGGTVNFIPETGASPIQLVVDGAPVSFTSSVTPPKEYLVSATWDATKEMYIITGANGGSNYSSFITGAFIRQPAGGTVKYRSPVDPSNNPAFPENDILNLTPKQVNGVYGWAFDYNVYKDLNFSLTGKTVTFTYYNTEYGENLNSSVVEGGSAVSVILTGTYTLTQAPNDSFPITSANVTPTSLTLTWAEPTFYTADAYQYKIVLSYFNSILNERIDSEEFVASNVLTKTMNGFFANTNIVLAVVPWYTDSQTPGPKATDIYEATTQSISGPVPDQVVITSVTETGTAASIVFTPPNSNGSTIETYMVTISGGGKTEVQFGTTSPIEVTNLQTSSVYDITVTAISNNGQGTTSTVYNLQTGDGGGGGGGGDSVTLTFVSSTATTATLKINATTIGTYEIREINGVIGYPPLSSGNYNDQNTDMTITLAGLTPSTTYEVDASLTFGGKDGGKATTIYTSVNTTFSTQASGGGGGGGGGSGTIQAGVSTTYGAATAMKMSYTPLVEISLDSNDINLVDAHAYGHRVQVGIPKSSINGVFSWSRSAGTSAPAAACDASGLVALLDQAILGGFTDLDAVATGLSFSSTALNSATDSRLRESGTNSANDIVMAYVLYKLYGSSAYNTIDNVFNLEDAHGMLSNEELKNAIRNSIALNSSAITKMFKNLISSDPQRFFTAQGVQVGGIFETNGDVTGSGNWNLTTGDIIEIRVKFTFGGAITRRGVANQELTIGDNTTSLNSGEVFYVRFQLVVQS